MITNNQTNQLFKSIDNGFVQVFPKSPKLPLVEMTDTDLLINKTPFAPC